jgi:hypothetical protein
MTTLNRKRHQSLPWQAISHSLQWGITALSLLLANCADPSILTISQVETAVPAEITPLPEQVLEQPDPQPPTQVVVLLDGSGSLQDHPATLPQEEGLRSLVDLHIHSGGELAVGLICTTSEQPLARLYIELPPVLNPTTLTPLSPPEPINENQNAFLKRQAQQAFDLQQAEYEATQSENDRLVAAHQKAVEAHTLEARTQAKSFFTNELSPFINQPANCQETDLWGSLARAVTYLNEPSGWATPPQRFLVVVSDGIDTIGSSPVALEGIEVLLVNGGAQEKGIFADIEHQTFENFAAVLPYIAAATQQGD